MIFVNWRLQKVFSFAMIILVLCLSATAQAQESQWQVTFNPGDRTVYEILACDLDEVSAHYMGIAWRLPNVVLQRGVQFTVNVTAYQESSSHPEFLVHGVYIFEEGVSDEHALNLNAFLAPEYPSKGLGPPTAVRPHFTETEGIAFTNRTVEDHTVRIGYDRATGWLAYYFDNSSEWLWEVIAIETILASSDAESNRSELGFHSFELSIFLMLAFAAIYRIKRRNLEKSNKKAC
ncbi:MAG: hypothetical protein ACXAB4_01660 [Candidatus Hodarchaeales archaeon]|jgi:hypothetical protein